MFDSQNLSPIVIAICWCLFASFVQLHYFQRPQIRVGLLVAMQVANEIWVCDRKKVEKWTGELSSLFFLHHLHLALTPCADYLHLRSNSHE